MCWIMFRILECGDIMPYMCDPDFCMEFTSIEEAKEKINEFEKENKILCVNTSTHEVVNITAIGKERKRETGIKDKHGTMIYEGDQLKIRLERRDPYEYSPEEIRIDNEDGLVIWKNGAFWVQSTPYVKHLLGKFNPEGCKIFEVVK